MKEIQPHTITKNRQGKYLCPWENLNEYNDFI